MFRWYTLILAFLLSLNGSADARVRTTSDATIVEVDLKNEWDARSATVPSGTYLLIEEKSCWTSDGHRGVCNSLRSCYPKYQLPELKNFESLNDISIRGTCQYVKADGTQAYGVCCPRQGFYFSPSGNNQIGSGMYLPSIPLLQPAFSGNPQFGAGIYPPPFPWLQPAGIPWWVAGGGGFPTYPSFPSFPSVPPALPASPAPPAPPIPPVASVDMGPPTTESWESWTTKTTPSPPSTMTTTTPSPPPTMTQPSSESWTTKPSESWESSTTTTTSSIPWTTTTPSFFWTTTPNPSTTTQQPATSSPPESSNEGSSNVACGTGPYKTLTWDEQSRIVGGTTARKNSWPFMVSMQSHKKHFCGASLIDSQYILTAAHCVASFNSGDVAKLDIVLAMYYREGDTSALKKRASRLVRHKGYNPKTLYNDIAIIKMSSPVKFGPTISPVCLPPASNTHSQLYGKDATVIGWGATRFQGPLPTALQEVTVQVQTNAQCKNNYGMDAPGDILDSMICAGLPGKDSCQGDSGGPMVMQPSVGSPWTQVGVVSWGIECSKPPYPGVYTSVAHYIGWINKNAI